MSTLTTNLLRLTAETLHQVDFGKATEAFQRLLKRAVLDCEDRPTMKKARKVTLEVQLTPEPEFEGNTVNCYTAKGVLVVKSSVPDYATNEIDFGIRNNGELVFNPDSPGNHRQMTMLDDE